MDAQRAIRLLRHKAEELGIDPEKTGMLGFSAGGNLAVFTGASGVEMTYEKIDQADELSARPDFLVTIYPAYMQESKSLAVDASTWVDAKTPPTFIAVSHNDVFAPSSVALYSALLKAEVAAELHIYPDGGHGYGLGRPGSRAAAWPAACALWLQGIGAVSHAER
jgi:acetyl esterase/lipase